MGVLTQSDEATFCDSAPFWDSFGTGHECALKTR